jgi:hypothetical protein
MEAARGHARPTSRRGRGAVVLATVVLTSAAGACQPDGALDGAMAAAGVGAGIRVSGWALDPDSEAPATVLVTVDGAVAGRAPADDARADLPEEHRTRGFDVTVPATSGNHEVCVTAVDVEGGDDNLALGCRTVRVPGRGSAATYSWFLRNSDGSPAHWATCSPIHYVTNTSRAGYSGAGADIDDALGQIGRNTGLRFVHDGEVTSLPSTSWGARPVNGAYPPVLIGWARQGETDVYGTVTTPGATLAVAYARFANVGGRQMYVSGSVAIHPDNLRARGIVPGHGPYSVSVVLMHEFAHLIGLGHVTDTQQLMAPAISPITDYGAGDLAGLARLGELSGCTGAGGVADSPAVPPAVADLPLGAELPGVSDLDSHTAAG